MQVLSEKRSRSQIKSQSVQGPAFPIWLTNLAKDDCTSSYPDFRCVCLSPSGSPNDIGQFHYFWNKLHLRVRHTRVHSVRIFADAARRKWVSKFPMAHNSKGLCLYVKFCLRIFVVSCFNLSEVR